MSPKIDLSEWPVAVHKKKKFKLFLSGPPGCFKTRVALGLANNGNFQDPAAAVIDTEFGTDHYRDQFAFRVPPIDPFGMDSDTVYNLVEAISKNPRNVKTLIQDSFSVYYDMVSDKWIERFLMREITSAGNKSEYYNLQPRDYIHINRDASKLVRAMLYSDLNVICICQVKSQYEFQAGAIKVVGQTADGWKRLAYYFDTLISIEKDKKGWKAVVSEKDRTNSFAIGEVIPWENDAEIVKYITKKFGRTFYDGPAAESFDPEAVTKVLEVEETKPSATDPLGQKEVSPEKLDENAAPWEENADDKQQDPAATIDPETVEKLKKPIVTATLMECLGEVRKLGYDKPELISAVKNLYGHEKPSMMTEGQGNELIKRCIRGEFPTIGNSVA